jgi:prepilin-type N-terminal cleavage/methylation domain-containing protein
MNKKLKLGFSLIELSIVILVVGILVIGITQGSRIMREAKLKSARALTTSSPINSIPDLAIWLDATSAKSFDDSTNNVNIQNWYNIDPRDTNGKKATQATAGNRPTYIDKAINGLPSIRFVRANSKYMSVADGFDGDSENVTLFLVWKPSSVPGVENVLLEKWSGGSVPYPYVLMTTTTYMFDAYDVTNNPGSASTTTRKNGVVQLISARRIKNGLIQLRLNGVQEVASITDNTTSATI